MKSSLSTLSSSLSLSSYEVFFTAGTLHWTTGSTILSHNAPGIYDMSDLLCFFSVIAMFDATLFYGDVNSSRFSYSNVIIILINSLCGTFPFLVKSGLVTPQLNRDTESRIEIVKQWILQSNLFEQHDQTID